MISLIWAPFPNIFITQVLELISHVNEAMRSFRKTVYYDNPRPHVSVASVNSDLTPAVVSPSSSPPTVPPLVNEYDAGEEDTFIKEKTENDGLAYSAGPPVDYISVVEVTAKIGNKVFSIPLK